MTTRSPLTACLLAQMLVVLCVLPTLADRKVTRSRAPQTWDPETERLFEANPLDLLKGQRPAAGGRSQSGGPDQPGSATPAKSGSSGALAWSDLISAAVISDEIKAHRLTVAESVRSPAVFRSGGNRKLRQQFSVIAVMFGISAQYEADVRWKQIAAAARDSFARAARNAKAADQNTFRESKARSDDLDELVRGGSVEFDQPEEKVLWSDVAQRRPLMARLKQAHEERLRPWTANQGEFERHLDEIRHEAEVLAALSEVIKHEEYEFYDDDVYVDYCSQMQDHAGTVSQAAKDKNLAEAQRAVGEISKVCSECHEGYR
ncbi:MAG: cytochrome c [Planctomycetota bacterium]|nr:cytochrome c [Planctomycetota bacterium]